MPGEDDVPQSSYSDPLYDRLDALSRQVRRLWWLFALSILVIILGAIAYQLWSHREPIAVGAVIAIEANEERDVLKKDALWTKLADGADFALVFRATACIELTQSALNRGDFIVARKRAQEAEDHARLSEDRDLLLAAGLSRAAVALDSGDAAAALDLYNKSATGAGARHPARFFEAELGAARCLESQGKLDDAIQRLEPLLTRSDSGADQLVQIARSNYWRLKRAKAGEPIPTAKPAGDIAPSMMAPTTGATTPSATAAAVETTPPAAELQPIPTPAPR